MAQSWLFALAFLFSLALVAASDWPVFQGAWFTVAYPPSFSPRPSLVSPSWRERFDSARFVAPDGTAAFYVFAPQWGGDPEDIRLVDGEERLKDESLAEKGTINIRWYTYERLDGTRSRAYMDKVDRLSNTRLILGIEYRSREALAEWREDFERFKRSLRQYAD